MMAALNEVCNTEMCKDESKPCPDSLFARYSTAAGQSNPAWRCYCMEALTADLAVYNETKQSDCVYEAEDKLQEVLKNCKFY